MSCHLIQFYRYHDTAYINNRIYQASLSEVRLDKGFTAYEVSLKFHIQSVCRYLAWGYLNSGIGHSKHSTKFSDRLKCSTSISCFNLISLFRDILYEVYSI